MSKTFTTSLKYRNTKLFFLEPPDQPDPVLNRTRGLFPQPRGLFRPLFMRIPCFVRLSSYQEEEGERRKEEREHDKEEKLGKEMKQGKGLGESLERKTGKEFDKKNEKK